MSAGKTTGAFSLIAATWLLLLALPGGAAALELNYPTLTIGGRTYQITDTILLHNAALFIYYSLVVTAGVIAFVGIVTGGARYLTSAGSPKAVSAAKAQLRRSFLGVIIILLSWVVLATLDPQLVVFPFFEEQAETSELPAYATTTMQDGVIFYTDHPEAPRIPVPSGNIHIDDTRRFPVGNTFLDISGRDLGGRTSPRITGVEFRSPETEIGTSMDIDHFYGVACFSRAHYRGAARIVSNIPQYFGRPAPTVGSSRFGPIYELNVPRLNIINNYLFTTGAPCGSVLVFRLPGYDTGLGYNPETDAITFFELNKDERERTDPFTGTKQYSGDCLKVGEQNTPPTVCEAFPNYLKQNWHTELSGDPGPIGKIRIFGEYADPDTGEPVGWRPRSLEITADDSEKYLVFLFQKTATQAGGGGEHWLRGFAYWFTDDVPDFLDTREARLYWNDLPTENKEIVALPGSAIIIQVEEVF